MEYFFVVKNSTSQSGEIVHPGLILGTEKIINSRCEYKSQNGILEEGVILFKGSREESVNFLQEASGLPNSETCPGCSTKDQVINNLRLDNEKQKAVNSF